MHILCIPCIRYAPSVHIFLLSLSIFRFWEQFCCLGRVLWCIFRAYLMNIFSLSLSISRFWEQFSYLGREHWKLRQICCSPSTSFSQIGRGAGEKPFTFWAILWRIFFWNWSILRIQNWSAFSHRNTILFLSAVSSAVTITKTSVDMYCSESYRSGQGNQIKLCYPKRGKIIVKIQDECNTKRSHTPHSITGRQSAEGENQNKENLFLILGISRGKLFLILGISRKTNISNPWYFHEKKNYF